MKAIIVAFQNFSCFIGKGLVVGRCMVLVLVFCLCVALYSFPFLIYRSVNPNKPFVLEYYWILILLSKSPFNTYFTIMLLLALISSLIWRCTVFIGLWCCSYFMRDYCISWLRSLPPAIPARSTYEFSVTFDICWSFARILGLLQPHNSTIHRYLLEKRSMISYKILVAVLSLLMIDDEDCIFPFERTQLGVESYVHWKRFFRDICILNRCSNFSFSRRI